MFKKLHQRPPSLRTITRQQNKSVRASTAVIAAICILMALCVGAYAQNRAKVTVSQDVEPRQPLMLVVDGKAIQAESMELKRGQQVMVWLRDLETLGWGVAEAGEAGEFLFRGKSVTLSFTKGQGVAKVNALAVELPVDTYMTNNKLMVPLSFVAKSLGYSYDLSYKAVATVITESTKTKVEKTNSIQGRVTYAGTGAQGVFVRAVDSDFHDISNTTVKTTADGFFCISGLPDGTFKAYVFRGDNPFYHNSASESVDVSGGVAVQAKTIPLRRIITHLSPEIDQKVVPANGKISVRWALCPRADYYELTLRKQGSVENVAPIKCMSVNALISASKLQIGVKYALSVVAYDSSRNILGTTAGSGGQPWVFSVAPKPNGR